MCHLETLETVARLSFLADDIEDRVDELSALGVMSLSPIVSGARLAEDKVGRPEEVTELEITN